MKNEIFFHKFLKYLSKCIMKLNIYYHTPLVIPSDYDSELKKYVCGFKTFGDMLNIFFQKEFYKSFSKFIRVGFKSFHQDIMQFLISHVVICLELNKYYNSYMIFDPDLSTTDKIYLTQNKKTNYLLNLLRKFIENFAEFVLIQILNKNLEFLGFIDFINDLIILDPNIFSIKKILRILSKLIIIKEEDIILNFSPESEGIYVTNGQESSSNEFTTRDYYYFTGKEKDIKINLSWIKKSNSSKKKNLTNLIHSCKYPINKFNNISLKESFRRARNASRE